MSIFVWIGIALLCAALVFTQKPEAAGEADTPENRALFPIAAWACGLAGIVNLGLALWQWFRAGA
jgi:hypothetical protein